jgi:uncharacterized membrane protein
VAAAQEVRRRKPRNAAADNRDARHAFLLYSPGSLLSMICHGQLFDKTPFPGYAVGMPPLLARSLVGIPAFILLDALWLGLLMTSYYRDRLMPLARLDNGTFAPHWPSAVTVWVLLGAGIACFVSPRATSLASAAWSGAVFGFVVYGVYDFTNYSTLRQWPLSLALVDLAWGTVACAACAAVIWITVR